METRQNDEDDWNEYFDDMENKNLREDESIELLIEQSIISCSDDIYDEECLKFNNLKQSSDDSFKTILTIDENKVSSRDNDDDESSDDDGDICLTTLEVSDFKIKLFKYRYPIPEDPGLVPGFWILYPKPKEYEPDGVEKFKDLVDIMKLKPIEQIPKMLRSDKIDLKYYGVDSRIIRTICEATFNNTTVKTLDLEDNWLTVDACFHLNHLLVNNHVLSFLNLSGCHIGPRGAKRLQEGIGAAPALRHLDVSRCDLNDEGLNYITTGVYCSSVIQIINLRDNKLSDGSGKSLQTLLTQTDSLIELNLSWNSLFNYEFWHKFINGLSKNSTVKNVDLSWNSLGKECSQLLAKYLSSPSCNLRKINLKGNRFEAEDAVQIAEAIMKNTTLEILNLENNPIEDVGAYAIIKAVTPPAAPRSQLRLLDLQNIWASKEVLPLMNEIKNKRPLLNIKLGGILSNYEIPEPDARKIFLKRANFEAMKPKKKKRRKNFGQFVLSLEDSIISRGAFENLIKRYKLKLRKSLVTEIMNAFTIGEDSIDQSALKTFYLKEYPDTQPAPTKPKKKKKKMKKKKKKLNDKSGVKKRNIKPKKIQKPKNKSQP
ncbi:hypothetical protein PV325_011923 [Microctonus aethiopoides]|nr:hypothetical protein PV325_011923 [Microctonus aethiopoides]